MSAGEGKGIYNFCLVFAGLLISDASSLSCGLTKKMPIGRTISGEISDGDCPEAVGIGWRAVFVGLFTIIMRTLTCLFVAYVGSVFLIATTSKVT